MTYETYIEKINQIRNKLTQVRQLPLSKERKRNELLLCRDSFITQIHYLQDDENESKEELTRLLIDVQERILVLEQEEQEQEE